MISKKVDRLLKYLIQEDISFKFYETLDDDTSKDFYFRIEEGLIHKEDIVKIIKLSDNFIFDDGLIKLTIEEKLKNLDDFKKEENK